MPKPTVYLETSVIGYLTSKPSRDLIVAAHQQVTQEWWENQRFSFDLYVSQFVLREIGTGNTQLAQERLEAVFGLPVLAATPVALSLADGLIKSVPLPANAEVDALHMAVAAVNGLDYLLTWNNKHIANARTRPKVEQACRDAGWRPPIICTPEELIAD